MLDEALASLGDRRVRFAFPSEIAAASTLVELLARSGGRALPARRFVGWDAFKSEVFAGDAAGRPSTKAIRSIFALMLMADNARSPFLRAIVPQAMASA